MKAWQSSLINSATKLLTLIGSSRYKSMLVVWLARRGRTQTAKSKIKMFLRIRLWANRWHLGMTFSIRNARLFAPRTSSFHSNQCRCSPHHAYKSSLCIKGISLGREGVTLEAGEILSSQPHSSDLLIVNRVKTVKEGGRAAQSVTKLLTLVMWFLQVLRIRTTPTIAYLILTKSSLRPSSLPRSSTKLSCQV